PSAKANGDWQNVFRPTAASPWLLPARPASSPDSRGRSCRGGPRFDAPPFGQEAVDVGVARFGTEADPDRRAGDLGRDAHRFVNPARLHAARRAGAAGRYRNAGKVELDELRRTGDARNGIGGD